MSKILETLYQACKQCRACPLHKAGATQVVPWEAGTDVQVMFVSEAPGEMEDKIGVPFQGSAGQVFDKIVAALSFQRGKETHVTNVVKCRPPRNRTPTKEECRLCGGLYLDREIEIVKPRALICFGKTAAEYILGITSRSLSQVRGRIYEREGIPVGVTFHPAYLLYNRRNEVTIKREMWKDITTTLQAAQISYKHIKPGQR